MMTQTTKIENFDHLEQKSLSVPLSRVGNCLSTEDLIELALDLVPTEFLAPYLRHIESCHYCAEKSNNVMKVSEFWEGERISLCQQKLETYIHSNVIEYIPTLIQILADNDPAVRLSVLTALGETGAPEVVPSIARSLTDEDADVRCNAEHVLRLINSKEAKIYLSNYHSEQLDEQEISAKEEIKTPLLIRLIEELQDFTVAVPGFSRIHAKTNMVDISTKQGLIRLFIETDPDDDNSIQLGLDSDALGLEGLKIRLFDTNGAWTSDTIQFYKATKSSTQVGCELFIPAEEAAQWHDTPMLGLEVVTDE